MGMYKNLKVGAKLIIGFILVAVIAGAIGVVGILNINRMSTANTEMYNKMTIPLAEMAEFIESYQRMRGNVKDLLLATSQEEIDEYEKKILERNTEFDTSFGSFQTTLLTEEGQGLVDDVLNNKEMYDALVEEIITMVRNGDFESAREIVYGEGNDIRTQIEADFERIIEIKIEKAAITQSENESTTSRSSLIMFILVIGGVILSIISGVFISNMIKKPIKKLVKASEEIAKGNLDIQIDVVSKDEMGELADSFRDMTGKINEVMTNINAASEQVAAGSRQVSDSSMSLSEGATEQASSIEELTASIEEISSQTRNNAEKAEKAEEVSGSSKKFATRGNEEMADMLKAMAEINDSSKKISKIIKVIDDIAFQTNILALNAAVEAARAGQHGKGFAVVAEEVRNLAARSAAAASETTSMIGDSIEKVEDGTKIANDTAEALNKIVEGTMEVNELVAQIASASNEQAIGIEQINQGIMQISDVVQTTSATAQETAAASEELSGQSEMLKSQVDTFKLKKNTKPMSANNEKINPDVLKMLDSMSSENELNNNIKEKKKISLSDDEFEKY